MPWGGILDLLGIVLACRKFAGVHFVAPFGKHGHIVDNAIDGDVGFATILTIKGG